MGPGGVRKRSGEANIINALHEIPKVLITILYLKKTKTSSSEERKQVRDPASKNREDGVPWNF